MSDSATAAVSDVYNVLAVGESVAIEDTVDVLESAFGHESLWHERTTVEARERLRSTEIHCVVCEFDPSKIDSTFEDLAAYAGEVPIVAVTDGTSSGAAIEAGATDVIESTDARPVVAARVENAASGYRRVDERPDRRYRSILENADAVVVVLETDGTVTYASSAAESRTGYTPDELERTPVTRLVHADDRERVRETLARVSESPLGSSERVDVRVRADDGTWPLSELTVVNRLDDPLIEGLVGTVSEAVATNDALETAIDRLRDPVCTLGTEFEVVYANEAAGQLFDAEPQRGTAVWNAVPDAVRSVFRERLREANASGEPLEFETTHPQFAGRIVVSVFPGEDGVSIHARESTGDDVPDESHREADRLDLLESTIDALGDGVAVLEGASIHLANGALFELTGAERLIGREIDEVFDDELAAAVRDRLESPAVRWMEPVSGTLTTGDDRPVDVFVTPFSDRDGAVCVVRDRRRSGATLRSAVTDVLGELRHVETISGIHRSVVDAVLTATGGVFVGWYRLAGDRLEPVAVSTADSRPRPDPPPVSVDGTRIEGVLEDDGAVVTDPSISEPLLASAGVRADRVLALPIDDENLILATSTEPLAFESLDLGPIEALADAASIALHSLESRLQIREFDYERERFETLVDRYDRLRADERAMLTAETKADVDRLLCEAVASLTSAESTGSIALATVGRVDTGGDAITPSTWAGDDAEFLTSVTIPADVGGDDETDAPSNRPEPTVIADLERVRDEPPDERSEWKREALRRGLRSVLWVPIEYEGFRYGTLIAFADRPSSFDDRTREICRHLTTVAACAIVAIERKRALLSEATVELEVVLRDPEEPLSTIAHHLGGPVEVRAAVPRSSGGSTVYCTVPGDGPLQSATEAIDAVESTRRLDADSIDAPVEFVLNTPTIAEKIADYGGTIRSITPVDDRTRIVLELPNAVAVRPFVRMLDRTYRGAELLARRERDRSGPQARTFDAELRDRLSERQLRTLEAAYYGGFFEWPRESTGEEIAQSLGVSQPTFSRHSRLAQRKLFELLFDRRVSEE
ncbi:bacterio-opsin activator domain-containing protein [Natrarchaeobius chitinivorans]|uniref:PAS domain S-box protein n=1 Tax=Natrarchaeobius chitinivorans TaxID=1679083 RepID=A0A3N6M0J6_NATCH|nr:bacterio-opsin activator domain-containing protein [Natrarchaeobius chitinivorans]RQG93804.1 PAS domain S-box protein [Natrarchaeobius chitinivorans]